MKTTFSLISLFAILSLGFGKPQEYQLDAVTYQQRIFEDLIIGLVKTLSSVAAIFDPLNIEHEEVSFLGNSAQITNLHSEGFSNFEAKNVSLTGLVTWTLKMVVVVPNVTTSVENWQVDSNHFYGNGTASGELEDFKLAIVAKINPIVVAIKDLSLTPSIGNANMELTGLYNNETLSQEVSQKLTDFLNDTVNNDTNLHDTISKITLAVLKEILNRILG